MITSSIISPKYDFFVTELFRNETVRRYFVGDVLGIPQDEIRCVRLRNTAMRKRRKKQKLGILDIVIELNDDKKINIELQVKTVKSWDKRQLFYLAKLYSEDLVSGEDYGRLKQCIGISILDFNLTDREEYHSVYRLRDKEGHEFSDALELHIIELRKNLTGQGEVDDWIRFFNVKTEEDLRMIKSRTKNPGILEAIGELRRMSMQNPLRLRYEAYLKRQRDEKGWREYVFDEARELVESGLKEAKEQVVQAKQEAQAAQQAKERAEQMARKMAARKAEEERLFGRLMERLITKNRLEDAKLAACDKETRKRLYREYGITEEIPVE